MMLTPEEEKAIRTRAAKPRNGHAVLSQEALQYLQQAKIQYQNMTGSAEWDYFLSQIQHWVELTRKAIEAHRAIIENPDAPENLAAEHRRYLLLAREREATLAAVIAFPKQIIEQGDKAELELQAIGEKAIESDNA